MYPEKTKQPSEVMDYDFTMGKWFRAAGDNDYIVSVDAEIDPPGELVFGSNYTPDGPILMPEVSPTSVKIWVSGGLDGREYKLTVRIRTMQGRVEEIDMPIIVEEQ